MSFVDRRLADAVRAISEVMFPANDIGVPDWQQTEMVARTQEYLTILPPRSRNLLYLLFVAIELGAPLLFVWPGRFSRAPYERRRKVLQRWRTSWFGPFKLLADALKAQLCMTYMSHPAVQEHMGVWKACERPEDPFRLPYHPDAFDEGTASGLRESLRQQLEEQAPAAAETSS